MTLLLAASVPRRQGRHVSAGARHLELLPPYSPELNPVESVWDYVREHYFANRAFPTIGRVDAQLCRAFRDLDAEPELVRSITLFDWIEAAKLTWT